MSNATIFLVLIVCHLAILAEGTPESRRFTLYAHPNHRGLNETLSSDDYWCHNLPMHFQTRASSIETNGNCIALFTKKDCRGQRFIFKNICESSECCSNERDFGDCVFYDKDDDGKILGYIVLDNAARSFAMC